MNDEIAVLAQALAVLDVPEEEIRRFRQTIHEDPLWVFTEAILVSSQWTVEVETFYPVYVLSDLAGVLERVGVAVEVDEKDDHVELFFPADNRRLPYDRPNPEGDFYYRPLREHEEIHDVVFSFALLLPKHIAIYALVYVDDSDTPGYVVLRPDKEEALRELLGSRFGCLFTKHPPGSPFRKASEPLHWGE